MHPKLVLLPLLRVCCCCCCGWLTTIYASKVSSASTTGLLLLLRMAVLLPPWVGTKLGCWFCVVLCCCWVILSQRLHGTTQSANKWSSCATRRKSGHSTYWWLVLFQREPVPITQQRCYWSVSYIPVKNNSTRDERLLFVLFPHVVWCE